VDHYFVFSFLLITVSLNHPVKIKPLGLRKLYEAPKKTETKLYLGFEVTEKISPEYIPATALFRQRQLLHA
jgi:hypothetical protein